MNVITTSLQSLELILDAAVATNQLPFVANYQQISNTGQESLSVNHGQSNGATAVTIVAAPADGYRRILKSLSVYNADTATRTVIIRLNDNATTRKIVSVVIATLEMLIYEEHNGWYCITTVGGRK